MMQVRGRMWVLQGKGLAVMPESLQAEFLQVELWNW